MKPAEDDAFIGISLWRYRQGWEGSDPASHAGYNGPEGFFEFTVSRVPIGTQFREGDRFDTEIETARTGYLYVVQYDDRDSGSGARNKPSLIFPTSVGSNNRCQAGKLFSIPKPRLPPAIRRSRADQVSKTLRIIVSREPITGLAAAAGPLPLSGDQMRKLDKAAGRFDRIEAVSISAAARPAAGFGQSDPVRITQDDIRLPQTMFHCTANCDGTLAVDVTIPIAKQECHMCSTMGPPPPGRVTVRAFLTPLESEEPGYGLYSYLLFGSRPESLGSDRWQRYQQAIAGLLAMPTPEEVLQHVPRSRLNVAFLHIISRESPGMDSSDFRFDPQQLEMHRMEHRASGRLVEASRLSGPYFVFEEPETSCILVGSYDYARAQVLLSLFSEPHTEGPYIISATEPLSEGSSLPRHYLYQDLSSVPAQLIPLWVKEFMNQARQPEFWKTRTKEQFILRLRTAISVASEQFPDLSSAIHWQLATTVPGR